MGFLSRESVILEINLWEVVERLLTRSRNVIEEVGELGVSGQQVVAEEVAYQRAVNDVAEQIEEISFDRKELTFEDFQLKALLREQYELTDTQATEMMTLLEKFCSENWKAITEA